MSLHALYRFWTAHGDLLYVGRSSNPARRFSEHRSEKAWWRDVSKIEIEHHADAASLAAAELVAIQTESPRHNVALVGKESDDDWWYGIAHDADPSHGCSEWDADDCPGRSCGRRVVFLTCSGTYVCLRHARFYGAVRRIPA